MRSHSHTSQTSHVAHDIHPCRPDWELRELLDHRANWFVHGPKSQVLGRANSLRSAIAMGREIEAHAHEVVAVVRNESGYHKIIVFRDQMRTLAGTSRRGVWLN